MKIVRYIFIISNFMFCFSWNAYAQNSCINCHGQLDDQLKAAVEEMMNNDSHHKNGISCADCHGGDPNIRYEEDLEAAMDIKKGYIGIPDRKIIPKLCTRCHSDATYMRDYNPNIPTDQYQQYLTSQHGQLLKKGDDNVAVCTDCHGVHNIQPANITSSKVFDNNIPETCATCHSDQTYMKSYNIPTDQFELYMSSVHGKNLFEKGDRFSPTCNDCHGNHGAYPPGISSISHVCGTCHITQAEMFSQSPHEKAFREYDLPQCESCHGNHNVKPTHIDMLGVGPKSLCINCHGEDSEGYLIARKMKQYEDRLHAQILLADSLLEKAGRAGVEVSDAGFILKDAKDVLIKARNAVHHFSLTNFKEIVQPGYVIAEQAVQEGRTALKEVQNRRWWLALISIIIFIASISLYIKIKYMRKENE